MLFDASVESASNVRAALGKLQVEVVEWSPSGMGWVNIWQKAKVDIVVVDYVLPKKDGLYVIEKIHEFDHSCAILFSHPFGGLLANTLENRAFELGAGGILPKPFTERRMQQILDRLLTAGKKKKLPAKVKMA